MELSNILAPKKGFFNIFEGQITLYVLKTESQVLLYLGEMKISIFFSF